MILCDREILALLDDGQILIDPRPPADSELWSSTAVDLTLHEVILEWDPKMPAGGGPIPPIVPFSDNFDVQGMMEDPHYAKKVPLDSPHGYLLRPRSFILAFTREKVRFPNRSRIAARVEGKSSLARLGVGVHVTAPTIHAGFGAKDREAAGTPIQLEVFNLGPWDVRLDAGMPICQLIFEEVREVPTTGYGGQFSSQRAFTVQVDSPSG
jgi:dCTP deaminase